MRIQGPSSYQQPARPTVPAPTPEPPRPQGPRGSQGPHGPNGQPGGGNLGGKVLQDGGRIEIRDLYHEAELRMLDIRQGIRGDLETIQAKLDQVFGDERYSRDVKALGKEFKETVQAALSTARENMLENGDFDGAALRDVVKGAFQDLRQGLSETLGISFALETPGQAAVVDVPGDGAAAPPPANPEDPRPFAPDPPEPPTPPTVPDAPQPGGTIVLPDPPAPPPAPTVASIEVEELLPPPVNSGASGSIGEEEEAESEPARPLAEVRENVRHLFTKLNSIAKEFDRAFGARDDDLSRVQIPEALDESTKSYLSSLLESIEQKGSRIDAAG